MSRCTDPLCDFEDCRPEEFSTLDVRFGSPTWSQAINEWQLETFGEASSVRAWCRFEEELEELIEADCPPQEPDAKLADEAADVVITLAGWLKARTGLDLAEAVEQKMRINRARKWNVRGDGTGYHVKPDGSSERTGGAE